MAYKSTLALDQVYHLAAAGMETILYGFYACLFLFAMYLMFKQMRSSDRGSTTAASKIFLVVIILMFLNATVHEFITIYRTLRAYGMMLGPKGSPMAYFLQSSRWDNYSHACMTAIMAWMADFLVIYRCYIIWGNNIYIIILPTLITVAAMGVNLTLFFWWGLQFVSYKEIEPVTNAGYPLMFAQNVLTTGLIIWKIVKQHRTSKAAGLVLVHTPNSMSLISVARIIIESALPYTLTLLVVIILYIVGHPLQFVVRAALIPTMGIVFVLIAIRVHLAREGDRGETTSSGFVDTWLVKSKPVFRHTVDIESSTTGTDIEDDAALLRFKVDTTGIGRGPAIIRLPQQPHYSPRSEKSMWMKP